MLEHAGYKTDIKIIDNLIKYFTDCQKHGKLLSRFKFSLKKDANFNYFIFINIIYIDGNPILYIVDEAIRFQAVRWLNDVFAKHT